ncbi:MAG: N-acetylmuramoyl-L-alanine amidase [Paraclostridium sp.]
MKKAYIDLGHGGNDSGAIGHSGVYEKYLVSDIGLRVRDLLVKNGVIVKLSRETDKTVSLQERVNDANNFGADCFVSIHCNSATNLSARGYETFCYSMDDLVKSVHGAIIEDKNLYASNRGIKTADFYVLKYTNMKACLCELGFISNEQDKDLIVRNKDRFATQIAKGICKYLGVNFSGGTNTEYGVGEYNKPVCITVDALNVRKGRGVEYEKIGQLNTGDIVEIWYIDKAKDGSLWGSFRYEKTNEIGFISLSYTRPL